MTAKQNDAWVRTEDGLIVCAGCFGGIRGRHVVIGGLPYHPPMVSGYGKGAKKVRVCNPPQPASGGRRKVNKDQLQFDLDGGAS